MNFKRLRKLLLLGLSSLILFSCVDHSSEENSESSSSISSQSSEQSTTGGFLPWI